MSCGFFCICLWDKPFWLHFPVKGLLAPGGGDIKLKISRLTRVAWWLFSTHSHLWGLVWSLK